MSSFFNAIRRWINGSHSLQPWHVTILHTEPQPWTVSFNLGQTLETSGTLETSVMLETPQKITLIIHST